MTDVRKRIENYQDRLKELRNEERELVQLLEAAWQEYTTSAEVATDE